MIFKLFSNNNFQYWNIYSVISHGNALVFQEWREGLRYSLLPYVVNRFNVGGDHRSPQLPVIYTSVVCFFSSFFFSNLAQSFIYKRSFAILFSVFLNPSWLQYAMCVHNSSNPFAPFCILEIRTNLKMAYNLLLNRTMNGPFILKHSLSVPLKWNYFPLILVSSFCFPSTWIMLPSMRVNRSAFSGTVFRWT